jgi:uncharacterized protein YndB with AHSA1/START domain
MSQMTDELVVRKSIVVACPVEHAFRVFTERMGDWWPFEHYSIYDGDATLVWEGRVGGRVLERSPGGEEGDWGTILAWEPPRSFAMTWHPGRDKETAQEIEVRFAAEGAGTRVEIVHTGWERGEADVREQMANYDRGWAAVLERFADVAGKAS